MPISYPDYWKEATKDQGTKYNKIKEIIDALNVLASEDHGDLGGLTDDDHLQYLLSNANRQINSAISSGLESTLAGASLLFALKSKGDATFEIEADSDDVTETDNPTLALYQDGRNRFLKMGIDSANFKYIDVDNLDNFEFRHNTSKIFDYNASGVALSAGARINEFSIDGNLAGDSDLAVPTEKAVNSLFKNIFLSSPFVQRISANSSHIYAYLWPNSTTGSAGSGIGATSGSTMRLYFSVDLPPYLVTLAAFFSKTITLTVIAMNWDDTVANDYITLVRILYLPYGAAGFTTLYNNGTDLGNGTISFRNDLFDVANQVMVGGDSIFIQLDITQPTTASSCRIKSFDLSYTIT